MHLVCSNLVIQLSPSYYSTAAGPCYTRYSLSLDKMKDLQLFIAAAGMFFACGTDLKHT